MGPSRNNFLSLYVVIVFLCGCTGLRPKPYLDRSVNVRLSEDNTADCLVGKLRESTGSGSYSFTSRPTESPHKIALVGTGPRSPRNDRIAVISRNNHDQSAVEIDVSAEWHLRSVVIKTIESAAEACDSESQGES